ncbi:hypothetical protein MSAN_02499100 [Mycena sanguinolenta]|uniref:DUF6699 domain-containing protein n=1 Tax=Mycena sanguinolenta TaxID=230812 RepID=A0A8H6U0T4_9AGAR|nr:hypothetical protein MSAN_02499100 [Mycena sanguinolenta]
MPSFFAPQGKKIKSSSRPATSLFRRFNDLYKPSATLLSSFVLKAKPKSEKISQKQQKTLFNPEYSVCVSLFPLDTRRDSGDSESNSSHSDAGSSRQTLELSTPSSELESEASPIPPSIPVRPQRPHIQPLRPALKQTTSSNSTATRTSTHDHHVSFLIPLRPDSPEPTPTSTSPTLHPPILIHSPGRACSHLTLAEPATEPPIYDQLVLRVKSDLTTNHFPWEIVVCPNAAGASIPTDSGGGSPRITRRKQSIPVTNLDVLFALYDALSERVTEEEWARLGHRSRVQRQIGHAYERRCVKLGGGWEAGVRRIDWLDGRTRLVGIEMIHSHSKDGTNTEVATLVFKTPA